MRVLFDHQTFKQQRYGGISLYISKLIEGINQQENCNAAITIPSLSHANLDHLTLEDSWVDRTLWNLMPHKGHKVSKLFSLYSLQVKKYDLFHATYYDPYFLKTSISRKPWTFTYHDLTHEKLGDRFPELKQATQLIEDKKRLTVSAPKIIAISETTKNDIVDYYQIDPSKVEVVYHGNPYETLTGNLNENTSFSDYPYLLFVGNRSGYKNFCFFIQSVAPLLKKYAMHVVCAGGGSFNSDETNLLNKLGVSQLVYQQPITNHSLPALYRKAVAFVFPSLYEGFGIPILEAFACQCPCVLSSEGSLPEVAGEEAALYLDPNEADSVATAVNEIITDSAKRTQLVQKGSERLKYFSWQRTVDQTLKVYQHLL